MSFQVRYDLGERIILRNIGHCDTVRIRQKTDVNNCELSLPMKICKALGFILGLARALKPNGTIHIPVAVLIDSLGGVNDDSDLVEAVFVRIDQLNHQNSSLIDPDATLVPTYYNYAQDNQQLISDTLDIISKKEIFIIGTGWSSYSTIASLISQTSLIPMCDGGSTNPSKRD